MIEEKNSNSNYEEFENINYNNTLNQQQDEINRTHDNTYIVYEELLMKPHEKFHSILNVLLNIKKKLFKL